MSEGAGLTGDGLHRDPDPVGPEQVAGVLDRWPDVVLRRPLDQQQRRALVDAEQVGDSAVAMNGSRNSVAVCGAKP